MIRMAVSTDVAAPAETVRSIYADYSAWPHLFPTIKGVRLIRRDGATVVLDIDHAEGHVINELEERSSNEIELRGHPGGNTVYDPRRDSPQGCRQAPPAIPAWLRAQTNGAVAVAARES